MPSLPRLATFVLSPRMDARYGGSNVHVLHEAPHAASDTSSYCHRGCWCRTNTWGGCAARWTPECPVIRFLPGGMHILAFGDPDHQKGPLS